MSLLEKATLITTPTAHSNGTLHSIKGGAVADFDVVRGSAATRVNAEGLIESVAANIPRIDYTTGEGVVLLEPQSTNLLTYSEDFIDASWIKGNITATNGFYAPDGTSGAYEIDFNSLNNFLFFEAAVTPSTEYNFSFYIKRGTATEMKYRLRDITNSSDIVSPTSYFSQTTSEWQRVDFAFTTPVGCTTLRTYPFSDTNSLGTTYVWGAQLEALPYATSYIPTSGAIATRLADKVTGAGDVNTFNDSEGVLYAEVSALADDGVGNRSISISNSSFNNRVELTYRNNGTQILVNLISSNTSYFNAAYTPTEITDFNKIAIKYKQDDFALWVNGSKVRTDTSGNTPIGLNELAFDRGDGAQDFYGKVKALAVFNEALTDSELECLTTI
jgi:hypothetical protein